VSQSGNGYPNSFRDFPLSLQGHTVCSQLSIYRKRLGIFPFKVQLFQGCKSETQPINTKSVAQHFIRYQVFLAAYYKADTKLIVFKMKYMNK
jgi:hypothetical protein